jgi:hypothetical protein
MVNVYYLKKQVGKNKQRNLSENENLIYLKWLALKTMPF